MWIVTHIRTRILISIVFPMIHYSSCRPGSSVGIATGYRLDGPGSNPGVGEARYSAPVQTGPGSHPPSCTGSFPGVKSGRDVMLTLQPPSSAVGHERV